MIKLKDIKCNDSNPRTIQKERIEKLKSSIQSFEKMMTLRPIVVNKDSMILGGNMRYLALKELGYTEIPEEWIKRAEELTEEEQRRFIIADNVGFGEWDWDTLANEWDPEQLEEWGLELPGWDDEETAEAEEDDYEVPDQITTDIFLGDLFEIGPHRLLCGDSIEVDSYSKLLDGKLIDLVITDPPYNVDYEGKTKDKLKIKNDKKSKESFREFLREFYTSLFTFANHGCPIYVFHADSEGESFRGAMIEGGWKLAQCLQWVKSSMVMGRQDYHWKHEPILYGWKEGAAHKWYSDRKQTTVIEFDRPNRNAEHPTMKPVGLLGYFLNNSSKKGDIICDPFGGSGSTMVASHETGRICYAVELDPKYCQVIIDRMIKLDPKLEVTRNGKKYEPKPIE